MAVSLAYRRVRNMADAEDIAQTAFLRLSVIGRRYRDGAAARAFFRSIVENAILEHLASNGREGQAPLSLSDLDEDRLPTAWKGSVLSEPEQKAHDAHLMQRVKQAVARLTPSRREAIHLRVFNHLKNADAAAVAGCSVPTLKQRIVRALRQLCSELGGPDDSSGEA